MNTEIENRVRAALNARASATADAPPPPLSGRGLTVTTARPTRPARRFGIVMAGGLAAAAAAGLVIVSRDQPGTNVNVPAATAGSAASTLDTSLGVTSQPTSAPDPSSTPAITTSITTPDPTTGSAGYTGWRGGQLADWIGTFDIAGGDVAFDVGKVGERTLRVEKTESSLCVIVVGSGCNIADPGQTVAVHHPYVDGSISYTDPSGVPQYVNYWILPNGVDLAFLDDTGSAACDMQVIPVPQLGTATVWMCAHAQPVAPGWQIRFTRDGVSHTKTILSDTAASID